MTFEGFVLDRQAGQLSRQGESVALAPQPFKLLDYFVSHPGRLVSRDELQESVWGSETFVDFERGLNFCILQVRTALGDDAKTPRFIETVPRRGYRFVAQVLPDTPAGRTADLALLEGLPPREAMLALRRINLRRFEERAATGWVDPYSMAAEHALLGDTGQALALLERAVEARSTNVPLMGVDPMLRSLRGDPMFQRLLLK